MKFALRALIGSLLWMMPGDERRAGFVESVALAGLPRAQEAFDHYRHGGGEPVRISTAALLRDDAGLRDALLRRLRAGDAGRVTISQRMATHRDWRCALGSVEFDCRHVPGGVEVKAHTRYGWHADQPRVTQAIHRLAVRLQRRGAQPFAFTGDRVILDEAQLRSVPARRTLPVRTFLL